MEDHKDIYIVRHGEREDYVNKAWKKTARSTDDPPLANKGRKQVTELASRFITEHIDIDYIFCSPFIRCIETAYIIAKTINVPINIEPGICEVLAHFPPGFLPVSQIINLFDNSSLFNINYHPFLPVEHLNEEYCDGDCIDRTNPVAKSIRSSYNGNLLFVGHGASCAGIIQAFTHFNHYQGLSTLSHLQYNYHSHQYKKVLIGDSAHLSDKSNLRAW